MQGYSLSVKLRLSLGFCEKVAQKLVSFQNYIVQSLLLYRLDRRSEENIRLGTLYGGWWVPSNVLQQGKDWLFISCGLGHDVSFDLELLNRGFHVIGIESEKEFVDQILSQDIPTGRFSLIHARVGTESSTEYNLRRLMNLAEENSVRLKVGLKMDIEGAEIGILEEFLGSAELPEILMFELDYLSLVPFVDIYSRYQRVKVSRRLLLNLRRLGYHLYQHENWNLHFRRLV